MAGERHERSETVQVHDRLLPPPFRPGGWRPGKRNSCALIGPCSFDVMDSTFDTTNQREGEVGGVRSPIRKWRDTVSEAANGRQGGGDSLHPPNRGSGGANCSDSRVRSCIHGASRRAEVSRACSLPSRSPCLRPTAFQTPEGKVTAALSEPAARRPQARLLGAPPTRCPVGAL